MAFASRVGRGLPTAGRRRQPPNPSQPLQPHPHPQNPSPNPSQMGMLADWYAAAAGVLVVAKLCEHPPGQWGIPPPRRGFASVCIGGCCPAWPRRRSCRGFGGRSFACVVLNGRPSSARAAGPVGFFPPCRGACAVRAPPLFGGDPPAAARTCSFTNPALNPLPRAVRQPTGRRRRARGGAAGGAAADRAAPIAQPGARAVWEDRGRGSWVLLGACCG